MNKPKILLWKHQKLANAWTLRIGDNRYIGLIRTDRNGESYWNFKEFTNKENSNNSSSSNQEALDKERLEKSLEKANEQPSKQPESANH